MSFGFIVAGLGNPGRRYESTRHNVGFRAVELIAEDFGADSWQEKNGAAFCSVTRGDEKILFVKPLEYMNDSGPPLARLKRFYQVPTENVLVVYDEIDLPFGKIRIKHSGGEGGHNGLRSVVSALGSKDFCRVRIGIGRPTDERDVSSWVLQKFSKEEERHVPSILSRCKEAVETILDEGFKVAQNRFN